MNYLVNVWRVHPVHHKLSFVTVPNYHQRILHKAAASIRHIYMVEIEYIAFIC